MNDMPDCDADDGIRGLWNRHRAHLPRFDTAHRETVLAAVADAIAVEPMVPARRPGGLLVAAVAAAIVIALPSWLAVVSLPALARAATAAPAAVSLGARAEAVGVALPADGSGRLAAVTACREPVMEEQAPGRGILRSIDIHTRLDIPHLTLGETF
jgi:hypothetical protein